MRYVSVCSGVESASLAWKPLGWEPLWFSEIEPFPCAVLKARYPSVPNKGDMTKIKGDPAEGAELLVGGTPCFVAGTPVLTPEGYVPIESLQIGQTVITADGNYGKISAIGNKQARTGTAKIVGKPPIVCTGNHPFLSIGVYTDIKRGSPTLMHVLSTGEFEYKAVEDSVGRYVGKLLETPPHTVSWLSRQKPWFIEYAGWFFSRGTVETDPVTRKRNIRIRFKSYTEHSTFQHTFDHKINGSGVLFNDDIAELLGDTFGYTRHDRRIPYYLYTDSACKKRFLRGVEAAQGMYEDAERIALAFVSPAAAYGIADLYGNASMHFRTYTQKSSGKVFHHGSVEVYRNSNKYTKIFNGRAASKLRKWENGKTETVYNITVDDDHTYVVGGVAVHNCQDASIAGKRAGLVEGSRSRLAFDFVRLAYECGVRWFVWENVPGVFSLNQGRDFAAFLSSFVGWDVDVPAGGWRSSGIVSPATTGNYGVAWRVLDAQYTRVDGYPKAIPQRRRRIFAVGYLGSWRYPAEVLLEPKVLLGDTPPRRKTEECVAESVEGDTGGAGRQLPTGSGGGAVIYNPACFQQNTRDEVRYINGDGGVAGCLAAQPGAKQQNFLIYDCRGRGGGSTAMITGGHDSSASDYTNIVHAIALAENTIGRQAHNGGNGKGYRLDVAYTQNTVGVMGIAVEGAVRRLLPVEAERLMGFPDNYTRIPWGKRKEEDCPDGPRYKACGNSMCVNCMRWIGSRIDEVDRRIKEKETENVLVDKEQMAETSD